MLEQGLSAYQKEAPVFQRIFSSRKEKERLLY